MHLAGIFFTITAKVHATMAKIHIWDKIKCKNLCLTKAAKSKVTCVCGENISKTCT